MEPVDSNIPDQEPEVGRVGFEGDDSFGPPYSLPSQSIFSTLISFNPWALITWSIDLQVTAISRPWPV